MKYSRVYTKDNETFFKFIKEAMRDGGIKDQHLIWGLCNKTEWNGFLSGEYMNKLMMNRLLDRMGCNGLRCDTLLFASEYDDWKRRMDIVFFINDGNIDCAKEELKKYIDEKKFSNNFSEMCVNDRLEYQFVLMMQVNIMLYEKHDKKNIAGRLKQAAELTIPQGTDIIFGIDEKLVLSVQELDILLEYYYVSLCEQIEDKNIPLVDCYIKRIENIFNYVQERECFNELSKAWLQPKALYYLMQGNNKRLELDREKHCEFVEIIDELSSYKALIEKYNVAVEALRKVGRTYYLVELCEMMKSIFNRIRNVLQEPVCGSIGINELENTVDKYQNMMLCVEEISGISRYTPNSLYMYFESNVYRMEDVIAKRRKFLGISQEKLADGICTAKTIRRLELGQCRPHGYNLSGVLGKLELYSDFVMEEIVSFKTEDMKILEKLYNEISENNIAEAEKMLQRLMNTLDMTYTRNRQTMQRLEQYFAYRKGNLTKRNYVDNLKKILGYSVKYEMIFERNNTYLTDCETILLQNMQNMERDEDRGAYLKNIPLRYERGELFIRKIELLKTASASDAGNKREYNESDKEFTDIIIKNCNLKRLYNVDRCIYGMLWNDDMQCQISTQEKEKMLNICIDISDFAKDCLHKEFYKQKINTLS